MPSTIQRSSYVETRKRDNKTPSKPKKDKVAPSPFSELMAAERKALRKNESSSVQKIQKPIAPAAAPASNERLPFDPKLRKMKEKSRHLSIQHAREFKQRRLGELNLSSEELYEEKWVTLEMAYEAELAQIEDKVTGSTETQSSEEVDEEDSSLETQTAEEVIEVDSPVEAFSDHSDEEEEYERDYEQSLLDSTLRPDSALAAAIKFENKYYK
jgi:hypothetical protein